MAEPLRQRCPPAVGAEAVMTVGQLAAFSLRQEAALAVCEARRVALVEAADAHNGRSAELAARVKRGWRLFGGGR